MTVRLGGWLILALLVLAFGVGGMYIHRAQPTASEHSSSFVMDAPASPLSPALSPKETKERWQDGVRNILVAYAREQKPEVARDALLSLRVAAEDREMHLAFVLAFERLARREPAADDLAAVRVRFEKAYPASL